jgi:hypothetical protein
MYTLLECLTIAGFVLVIGAGAFLAVAVVMLLKAGVRFVVTELQALASRAHTELHQKSDASPLAQATGHGD